MALATTIQVRISSEAAEAVSLTPVVVRDLPMRELLEHLAAAVSTDPERVRDLLKRGSLVSGASRFRWQPFEPDLEDLAPVLSTLPKSDPSRPFDSSRAVRLAIVAGARRWELSRADASNRTHINRLLLRPHFWNQLLAILPSPQYALYLYKDRADLYRAPVDDSLRPALHQAAALLPFAALRAQLRSAAITAVEWYVER